MVNGKSTWRSRLVLLYLCLGCTAAFAEESLVLEAGDVVCRDGSGMWSKYFKAASTRDKRFSHVGIVVETADGLRIAHAIAEDTSGIGSVRTEPFRSFVAGTRDWAVFRLKAGPGIRKEAGRIASAQIGKPFDVSFDLGDASRLYCSELVHLAINRATGELRVGTTAFQGRTIVAIDDCHAPGAFEMTARISRE